MIQSGNWTQLLSYLAKVEQRLRELENRTIGQQRMGPSRDNIGLSDQEAARAKKFYEEIAKTMDAEHPVDCDARELTSGKKEVEDPEYRELKDNGQQRDYVVLSPAERARGFVRPVRREYVHQKCGMMTVMSQDIAETYARVSQRFIQAHFVSNAANISLLVKQVNLCGLAQKKRLVRDNPAKS